jgi:hypothetical protein
VQQARRDWQDQQPKWDMGRLVFLDETWITTSMTRLWVVLQPNIGISLLICLAALQGPNGFFYG